MSVQDWMSLELEHLKCTHHSDSLYCHRRSSRIDLTKLSLKSSFTCASKLARGLARTQNSSSKFHTQKSTHLNIDTDNNSSTINQHRKMLSPESKLIAGFGGVVLGFLCILASPAMSIYGCFHGPPTLWPLLPLFIGALLVPFGYYLGVKAVRVMGEFARLTCTFRGGADVYGPQIRRRWMRWRRHRVGRKTRRKFSRECD